MTDRINIAEAERQLQAAGFRTEREFAGNIVFFLAVRGARGIGTNMPTKLEVHNTAAYGQAVSNRSVKRLLNKGPK